MPRLGDMTAYCYASTAMMFARKDAIERLDVSADGFWQSFWALLFALPANLIVWNILADELLVAEMTDFGQSAIVGSLVFIEAAAFVFGLLALVGLAKPMDYEARIAPLVISSNWGYAALSWLALPYWLIRSTGGAAENEAAYWLVYAATLVMTGNLYHGALQAAPWIPVVLIVVLTVLKFIITTELALSLGLISP